MADRRAQPEHLAVQRDRDRRTAAAGPGVAEKNGLRRAVAEGEAAGDQDDSGASMVMKSAGPRRAAKAMTKLSR